MKYRLVTRADFDGVVSGVLLRELDVIDEVAFAAPNDMQAGRVPVTARDITTNLPYVEGVRLCFDHHVSETVRVGPRENHIIDAHAPSAARVVYNHFGGRDAFPEISLELMAAVDRADTADYTEEDILAPSGWTLLNFLIDPRTGLARVGDFAISNEWLMTDLMGYCRRHGIDEILEIPDIVERRRLYDAHGEDAEHQIRRLASMRGDVLVVDMRGEKTICAANRFLVYALFPQAKVSLHAMPPGAGGRVELAAGRSILDRSARANLGGLMLAHGGGGHAAAGTCQVASADADGVIDALVAAINAAG